MGRIALWIAVAAAVAGAVFWFAELGEPTESGEHGFFADTWTAIRIDVAAVRDTPLYEAALRPAFDELAHQYAFDGFMRGAGFQLDQVHSFTIGLAGDVRREPMRIYVVVSGEFDRERIRRTLLENGAARTEETDGDTRFVPAADDDRGGGAALLRDGRFVLAPWGGFEQLLDAVRNAGDRPLVPHSAGALLAMHSLFTGNPGAGTPPPSWAGLRSGSTEWRLAGDELVGSFRFRTDDVSMAEVRRPPTFPLPWPSSWSREGSVLQGDARVPLVSAATELGRRFAPQPGELPELEGEGRLDRILVAGAHRQVNEFVVSSGGERAPGEERIHAAVAPPPAVLLDADLQTVATTPAVSSGVVFSGDGRHVLALEWGALRVDTKSGTVLGKATGPPDGSSLLSVHVVPGTGETVGITKNGIHVLDPQAQVWSRSGAVAVGTSITAFDETTGTIVIVRKPNRMIAVELKSLRTILDREFLGERFSGGLVAAGGVAYAGTGDGRIVPVDLARRRTGSPIRVASAGEVLLGRSVSGKTVVAAAREDRNEHGRWPTELRAFHVYGTELAEVANARFAGPPISGIGVLESRSTALLAATAPLAWRFERDVSRVVASSPDPLPKDCALVAHVDLGRLRGGPLFARAVKPLWNRLVTHFELHELATDHGFRLENVASLTLGVAMREQRYETLLLLRGRFDADLMEEAWTAHGRFRASRTDGEVRFARAEDGAVVAALRLDGLLLVAPRGGLDGLRRAALGQDPASNLAKSMRRGAALSIVADATSQEEWLGTYALSGVQRVVLRVRARTDVTATAELHTASEARAQELVGQLPNYTLDAVEWSRDGRTVRGRMSRPAKRALSFLDDFVGLEARVRPEVTGRGQLDVFLERSVIERFAVAPNEEHILVGPDPVVLTSTRVRATGRGDLADDVAYFTGDDLGVVVWRPGALKIGHRLGRSFTNTVPTPAGVKPGLLAPIRGTAKVVAASGGRLWEADMRKSEWSRPAKLRASRIDGLAMDPATNTAVVLTRPGTLEVVDLLDMKSRFVRTLPEDDGAVTSRVVTAAGFVFVGTASGGIRPLDLRTGEFAPEVLIASGQVVRLAVSSSAKLLAAAASTPRERAPVLLRLYAVGRSGALQAQAEATYTGAAVADLAILESVREVWVGGKAPMVWSLPAKESD